MNIKKLIGDFYWSIFAIIASIFLIITSIIMRSTFPEDFFSILTLVIGIANFIIWVCAAIISAKALHKLFNDDRLIALTSDNYLSNSDIALEKTKSLKEILNTQGISKEAATKILGTIESFPSCIAYGVTDLDTREGAWEASTELTLYQAVSKLLEMFIDDSNLKLDFFIQKDSNGEITLYPSTALTTCATMIRFEGTKIELD